jgi:hypothetical protein
MSIEAIKSTLYYLPLLENYKENEVHIFDSENLISTLFIPRKFYEVSSYRDINILTEILDEMTKQHNSFLFKDVSHLIFNGERRYIFKKSNPENIKVATLYLCDYITKKKEIESEEQNEIYKRLSKIACIGTLFGLLAYI